MGERVGNNKARSIDPDAFARLNRKSEKLDRPDTRLRMENRVGAVEEAPVLSLRSISLLRDIPPSTLDALEHNCRWGWFDAGMTLIERGQSDEDVFFMISGRARVVNYSLAGRIVSYALLKDGDCFGELSAIDGMDRSATVKADTMCVIAILSGARFRQLIMSEPKIAMAFLQHLAGIVRSCDERIFDLVTLGAKQRVCMELLRLAKPDGADLRKLVVYPVSTQDAIARSVGITRRTVSRVFRSLIDDHKIERKNKTLLIVDREYLEGNLFERKQ